jgi:NADH dehydrogenase [ubiquinone] 1 alpha subcomplex assembly factor 1
MSPDLEILFDFARPLACPWPSIDDVVMGGVSHSSMSIENGRAVFEGTVSLDRGGGFASVRSLPGVWDLHAYTGIQLTLRGDGHRYKLRLKSDSHLDRVNWETAFLTDATGPQTLRFPFRSLAPVYRGKAVPSAPPFNPSRVATFGLLISDKQAGHFRLEIEVIAAYR